MWDGLSVPILLKNLALQVLHKSHVCFYSLILRHLINVTHLWGRKLTWQDAFKAWSFELLCIVVNPSTCSLLGCSQRINQTVIQASVNQLQMTPDSITESRHPSCFLPRRIVLRVYRTRATQYKIVMTSSLCSSNKWNKLVSITTSYS